MVGARVGRSPGQAQRLGGGVMRVRIIYAVQARNPVNIEPGWWRVTRLRCYRPGTWLVKDTSLVTTMARIVREAL